MSEPTPRRDAAFDGAPPVAGPSAGSGLGWLAGPSCLVILAGLAMPPHHGWLVPVLLALVMTVIGQRRVRAIARAHDALREAPALARGALLVVALGTAGVLLTVLARGVGALLVDVPAAIWGVGAALAVAIVYGVVQRFVPARGRPVLLLVLAVAVPLAGVHGTRYEAEGSDARGFAQSGPILGIHPFQMTSILVDGHGPFDVPFNDYVEPDGSRGYGPEALADAFDRALVSIADRVYADGPARIRRALIDAEVEALTTPAVHERLDREPFESTQARIRVRSGSFGDGSRIELVCPGRRIDPRGPQGESVMNRMCPDKYAAEASAGLGVTGRWSGYSEGRGNARLGWFRRFGWTRGSDDEGRSVIERETRIWAWLVLALVGLVLLRPAAGVAQGLRGVAGALFAAAVVLLVLAAFSAGRAPVVGAWSTGPQWVSWLDPTSWTPALALAGMGLFALGGRAGDGTTAPAVAVPAVLVVVASLALAAVLPALSWAFPVHGSQGAALTPFVRGLADAVGERGGLTIFEVEGAIASSLAAILLGGAVATAGAGLAAARTLWPTDAAPPLPSLVAGLAMAFVAVALVFSRKTAGASALMPGVIGMTLVLGSALRRISSGGRPSPRAALAHLSWTALALALVWSAVAPLPQHWFVTVCAVAGLAGVIAAGLSILARRSSEPGREPLESPGSGRL